MSRAPSIPADLLSTDRLPWDDRSSARPEDARFSLVVIHNEKTWTYPLPATGTVVIGRGPNATIRIDHGSVSREHLSLELGPELRIRDLESANGTRVRDVPLAPGASIEVFPDDVVDIGAVLLVVQYRDLAQRVRRCCAPAFFDLAVDEASRDDEGTRACSVAEIEIHGELGAHAIQRLLAAELEKDDLLTTRTPHRFELLLRSTDPAERGARLARIVERLTARGLAASVDERPRTKRSSEPEQKARPAPPALAPIIAVDEATKRVLRLTERVAASALSVIFLGETGVGKEICAEYLHRVSPRHDKPFVRLNCSALADTLLESELFGHERGAFTGANAEKIGLLEAASGGTIFFDEIGDMPLATQVKLLRVIESKEVTRVGSVKARPVDLRVVSATHCDLEELVTAGRFREDLYYRLHGISIIVPPLRERVRDIDALARYFVARFAKGPPPALSTEVLSWLTSRPWPGNVRELRNTIERAVALCEGSVIEIAHLGVGKGDARDRATHGAGLRGEVKALEREQISRALAETEGNQSRAAERLGISRGALLRRLVQLGIGRTTRSRS